MATWSASSNPRTVNNILEFTPSLPQSNTVHHPNWGYAGQAGPTTQNRWNHIIPYNLLRDVWNGLVATHITTEIPQAPVALRKYLLLLDPKLDNVLKLQGPTTLDRVISRMRAENPQPRSKNHPGLQALEPMEKDLLQTAAAWPAWNIFAGPAGDQQRWDEPHGDNMEHVTGLGPAGARRMREIKTLYGQLLDFGRAARTTRDANDLRPAVTADDLKTLSRAVEVAGILVRADRPIPYDSNMWKQVEKYGRVRWVQSP